MGIRILAGAGFDPRAMAGVFEKLQNAARYSPRPPEFLLTHPSPRTESRRLGTARNGFRTANTKARSVTTSSVPSCEYTPPTMHGKCSIGSSRNTLPVVPGAPLRTPMGKRSR